MLRIKFYFPVLVLLLTTIPSSAQDFRTRAHQVKEYIDVDDVKAEIRFGREVAAKIIGRYSLVRNKKLNRYINLIGKSIASYSNRPELNFTFGILDTDIINAFSAPGGYIFITKGAIQASRTEDELAGIIAHEIVHVSEKHIVKELKIKGSDSSAAAGLSRVIGGASDTLKVAFVQAVEKADNILFNRGYMLKDEIEADTYGTMLLANLNYNIFALVNYFERIKPVGTASTASLRKLHPPFDDRIKLIKETITNMGLEQNDTVQEFRKTKREKRYSEFFATN